MREGQGGLALQGGCLRVVRLIQHLLQIATCNPEPEINVAQLAYVQLSVVLGVELRRGCINILLRLNECAARECRRWNSAIWHQCRLVCLVLCKYIQKNRLWLVQQRRSIHICGGAAKPEMLHRKIWKRRSGEILANFSTAN